MIPDEQRRLVLDIDGVIAKKQDRPYEDLEANEDVVEQIRDYRNQGFYIILSTARNMRSFEGRIGKINAETAPVLHEWLDEHDVPYDELHLGKPWCGREGFYVDDNAVRPSEFEQKTHEQIMELLDNE